MRRWDYKAAQRPDYFIANSNHTKEQIEKYYGREAEVIHPPVDIERFKKLNQLSIVRKGFVTAGRQVPYKKIDLAVKAATELNVPLIVIGRGPDHRKLKRLAGRSVTFLRHVSDEEMPKRFGAAQAFIFPTNMEDFGITGVEAMAAGTPVIAYKVGGPTDYIIPGKTGLFFEELTSKSLVKTLQDFSKITFNYSTIAEEAEKFLPEIFSKKIKEFVKQVANVII